MLIPHTLTEMDNYFPGAFFTLVPFNPNPVNHGSSWIRVKTWPQYRHSGKVSATGWD